MIFTLNIQGSPSELTQALLALAALDTGANVGFTASTSPAGDPVKVEHSEKEVKVVPISGEKKGLPKVHSEPAPKQKKTPEPEPEEKTEDPGETKQDEEDERISLEALRVPFNTLMKTKREALKDLIQNNYDLKSLTEFDAKHKDTATRREFMTKMEDLINE